MVMQGPVNVAWSGRTKGKGQSVPQALEGQVIVVQAADLLNQTAPLSAYPSNPQSLCFPFPLPRPLLVLEGHNYLYTTYSSPPLPITIYPAGYVYCSQLLALDR